MARNYVRFRKGIHTDWGTIEKDSVQPCGAGDLNTRDFLDFCRRSDHRSGSPVAVADLQILSPITAPCQVICQGANYRQHVIESGLNPDDKTYNMFFTKSDASITEPVGDVIRPARVKLLDYEIELGLVFGKHIDRPVQLSAESCSEYVAALFMANDISARDIQIPQLQWYKGKSYRTFLPAGPVLAVLEPEDYTLIESLDLTLTVNNQVRQKDNTANLVFKPAESISELSGFCSLAPGDVLLTGTPAGCALRAPGKLVQAVAGLLPEKRKWELFIKGQSKRREYLNAGDVIRSSIRSADGRIDLGEQILRVVQG